MLLIQHLQPDMAGLLAECKEVERLWQQQLTALVGVQLQISQDLSKGACGCVGCVAMYLNVRTGKAFA